VKVFERTRPIRGDSAIETVDEALLKVRGSPMVPRHVAVDLLVWVRAVATLEDPCEPVVRLVEEALAAVAHRAFVEQSDLVDCLLDVRLAIEGF